MEIDAYRTHKWKPISFGLKEPNGIKYINKKASRKKEIIKIIFAFLPKFFMSKLLSKTSIK